ncbi:MAG: hypothetical protein HYX79_05840 [Chloroflexi bacterium]|nr:hypothetical protein [Chloroflexota bacterium]
MKWKEIYMICGEEMQRIPSGNEKQDRFRASYSLTRRDDLEKNPKTPRRDTFLKCLAEMERFFPEFKAADLRYDTDFFGPPPAA